MESRQKHSRAWLLSVAKVVATQLKARSQGTGLRIHVPAHATPSNTDGWFAIIGNLGVGQPRLEVWLDRFSGYSDRKFYACLRAPRHAKIEAITRMVSKKLWPVRTITEANVDDGKSLVLTERLARSEFNLPLLEKYEGRSFYGIYDLTRRSAKKVSPHFCARAIAFFEDVARALPNATAEDEQRDVYPRFENRKRVISHLYRERSKLLAVECKIRDEYQCQVCGFRFEDVYGKVGSEFAEAHHLIPLKGLGENIRTRIEDLATVCANCHRMLHRMAGRRDDVRKLKAIMRKHRR